MQTFRIDNLTLAAVSASADRICYMLYPFDGLEYLIEKVARAFDVTMVMITGMDWDNDLTPWPAKGEPPGSPDFEGLAPEFFKTLTTRVLSTVESSSELPGMPSGHWPASRCQDCSHCGNGC